MEVELFSNVISEEDTVEVGVVIDNFGVEGERCGMCMDIVLDRGVLDCCQHWFCFACIDNWATITNLCPLCQNEFQLITCVPVYDTIGGSKTDEDSDFRDEDWCVEGKNSTLSFPSYYIDENAVTCLDGDSCKIRSESVTDEETLILDTSVACDSCDIWYHAACVGFDPESADVDSWLCPRCLVTEAQQKSDFRGTYRTRNQLHPRRADCHCLINTFSGKVSISAAHARETAVVVSKICGELGVEEPIVNGLHTQEVTINCEIEKSVLGPDSCSSDLKNSLDQRIISPQLEPTVPSAKLRESIVKSGPNESGSRICLNLGSSLDATLSEDDKTKILLGGDGKSSSIDETLEDLKADLTPKVCEKRKRSRCSFLTNSKDVYGEVKPGSGSSTRKVRAHQGIRRTSLNGPAGISASDKYQKTNSHVESSGDEIG